METRSERVKAHHDTVYIFGVWKGPVIVCEQQPIHIRVIGTGEQEEIKRLGEFPKIRDNHTDLFHIFVSFPAALRAASVSSLTSNTGAGTPASHGPTIRPRQDISASLHRAWTAEKLRARYSGIVSWSRMRIASSCSSIQRKARAKSSLRSMPWTGTT